MPFGPSDPTMCVHRPAFPKTPDRSKAPPLRHVMSPGSTPTPTQPAGLLPPAVTDTLPDSSNPPFTPHPPSPPTQPASHGTTTPPCLSLSLASKRMPQSPAHYKMKPTSPAGAPSPKQKGEPSLHSPHTTRRPAQVGVVVHAGPDADPSIPFLFLGCLLH